MRSMSFRFTMCSYQMTDFVHQVCLFINKSFWDFKTIVFSTHSTCIFFLTFLSKMISLIEEISQLDPMSFWIKGFIDELKIAAVEDAFLTDAQSHWKTLSFIYVLLSLHSFNFQDLEYPNCKTNHCPLLRSHLSDSWNLLPMLLQVWSLLSLMSHAIQNHYRELGTARIRWLRSWAMS